MRDSATRSLRSPISGSSTEPVSTLIIHAHPVPDSLNRALFSAAREGLSVDGALPSTASLCDGDDPTAEDLADLSTLVFVYPTWWGGPPSILLDWTERRLGPWIDGTPSEASPIAVVRQLAVITTHGSPKLLNVLTGEPGRRLFGRSVRELCAPDCTWHWLAYYGIDAHNTKTRNAFVSGLPDQVRSMTRP